MTTDQIAATTTVYMPVLGESIEEGTITRWLKSPGEHVAAEEPLLEVATDKVDTEIPAPTGGILEQILVEEDSVVAVGTALAIIAEPGGGSAQPRIEPSPPAASQPPAATTPPAPSPAPAPSLPTPDPSSTADRGETVTIQPPTAAAERAQESSTTAPAQSGATVEKLPRIRRTIAARMVESLQTSAQLTSVVEVDITAIAALRAQHKETFLARTGVKLSYLPFFAKAAVEALTAHRMLNASLNPEVTEVTYYDHCHLGMAVDSDKGLMVPVIRDADTLTISGLAQAIADKAEKVRSGTITPDELGGGTFTLTNTGSRGALFDTPIINQPQTGILGTGSVVERLVPRRPEGALEISVRSMAYLSLSYDHRIVDGADAARFLTAVKHKLENGFTAADLA
ncbi:2-oxo acid dehydrogenase subunit E2 [Nocardia fusca]|uniref:2-oxo acid dehydrogenase subunit E2 n=1 Tax=Nocardia fusca TaxID=941183 RepID=UPI0037CBC734